MIASEFIQLFIYILWATKFCTFILYALCIFPLLSPSTFSHSFKKPTKASHKKVFWTKTSASKGKYNPQKPYWSRWEWQHNTPSLHLVPFCRPCTPQNCMSTCTLVYSHPLNEYLTTHQQGTQHYSFHSLLHVRQPIHAMFSSNKVHNITDTLTCTAHALHSFCIQDVPHLLCSVAIRLQPPTTWLLDVHQIYYMPMQHYPPHCLPQLSYAHK